MKTWLKQIDLLVSNSCSLGTCFKQIIVLKVGFHFFWGSNKQISLLNLRSGD